MRSFWDMCLVMVFFTLTYAFPWVGVFFLLLFVGYYLLARRGTHPLAALAGRPAYARPNWRA
jgi:hypothetical protein